MRNIALSILEAAAHHGESVALRQRRDGGFRDISYARMADMVERTAAGLVGLGVQPGDRVGIFSPNLPEWIVTDLAVFSIRAVSVPIYATNTAEQARQIVEDSGLRILCVGQQKELEATLAFADDCPQVETIITLDRKVTSADPRVRPLEQFAEAPIPSTAADEIALRRAAATDDDLATIIYTSGTTGEPKGVLLRHRNFVNQYTSVDRLFQVDETDRSLCFLPLSHVYERTWTAYVLLKGATNTILSNPREVVNALAETRPTVMVSAPRLYEKVHAAITARVESAPPLRRKIFAWAMKVGDEYWRGHYAGEAPGMGLKIRHALADRLVLRKLQAVMGGPKNFLSSGGAPLAKEVEEFFLSMGLLVCQGYGLTETAPMLTCNSPGAFRFGTVGTPIDGVEIRTGPEGEIEVRGPNVTEGYYGRPEATARSFRDGWFRTGDVGHVDDDGYVVITDRIKDIIVTSGGKNVAPQRIECVVGKDHYIDQLAVVGDRRKFIGAIVVPAFEALKEFAASRRLKFNTEDDLIKLPEVVELYRDRIRAQCANLAPFEKVKRFTLVARQFSMAAGEITPTLKIRRRVVAEKYREIIDRMYRPEPNEGD
ncbi:MAG: long-chain fatty acid--CoA ligase [bacterium]|nr:long-chain fatty acid--CoA ligase [bacterium]